MCIKESLSFGVLLLPNIFRRQNLKSRLFVLFAMMYFSLSALELHGTFSDHMVLQRNHKTHVYGKRSITLKDVVIGDVWVCSGQSNMEWGLNNTQPMPQTFPHADKLRMVTGKLVVSPGKVVDNFVTDPKCSPNGWKRAEKEAALNTSAVS